MKFYIFAAALLAAFNAYSECKSYGEYYDLRKSRQEIMNKLPIYDQGNFGYCYAYSGKFLYDFSRFLKKHNDGQNLYSLNPTSAVWAAALSMKERNAFTEESGHPCDVVNGLSSTQKNCSSSVLTNLSFYEIGPEIYRFLFDRDNLMSSYQGTANPRHKLFPIMDEKEFSSSLLKGEKKTVRDGFFLFHKKIQDAAARREIDTKSIPSAFYYYNLVSKHHQINDYASLPSAFSISIVQKSCQSWEPFVKVRCNSSVAYSWTDLDNDIERNRPVGISYCATFLKNKNYRGLPIKSVTPSCNFHASVVIGRKMTSRGECKYLIRNSWGKSYSGYDWETDQGDIWVSENALRDNLKDVQIVK